LFVVAAGARGGPCALRAQMAGYVWC